MEAYEVGKVISKQRKKLHLTQKDLSEKLYVSDKAVSKWERGLCFPDISILLPLTEVLEISLYDLLKGKTEKTDVEEILKTTVEYSEHEINRKKKKHLVISATVMTVLLVIGLFAFFKMQKRTEIHAVTDRDTVYGIECFTDAVIGTEEDWQNGEKKENILTRLPLNWTERSFQLNEKNILVQYGVPYRDVVRAYRDEHYVKLSVLDISAVLFTVFEETDTVTVEFSDRTLSVSAKDLLQVFECSDYQDLRNRDNWSAVVGKKLADNIFVEHAFETVVKNESKK